jgi:hypothetical protein
MRNLFYIIIICLSLAFGCVKKRNATPEPVIEYKDFSAWKTVAGNDTAVMVIGYEDGDGDIFRESNLKGPNLIGTFYYLNSATNKFTAIKDEITNDTMRITQTIVQPKEGSYKGRSVRGEMYLPWAPFRSGDSVKVFKYTVFVVDDSGKKSNIVTTPTFSINF